MNGVYHRGVRAQATPDSSVRCCYREDAVNEIRILASIKHKNIVRYCEAFVEGDALFIVMEFAERGDINGTIKKAKRKNAYVPEDTIWCYLMQICMGLQHLHGKNILHRVRGQVPVSALAVSLVL